MKPNILICFTILIGIYSCSHKTIPTTANVNYISSSDGTLTMHTIGVGKNMKAAIFNAEKNVFEVLLFRGLPNTAQKLAILGYNDFEIKQNNQAYFQKLYEESRYKTFLMYTNPISNLIKIGGGNYSITAEVQINLLSLKKDLEENNVLRKFGY